MSIERDDGLAQCPNCNGRYEIAAVKLCIAQTSPTLFVCTSCGLARVEAPTTPMNRPRLAWRVAISFIVTAPAVFYVVMRLLAFEYQPVQTDKLTISIEGSRSYLDEVQTHHQS